MINKLILWSMLLVPWFTLFFMKKKGFRRYISVSIFTSLLVTIVYEIASSYKWWKILVTIAPWGHITNVSYAYGVFFVGTLWIFYLTYDKFWVYLVTNIVVDGIDAFLIREFMQSRNIIHYENISKLNLFFVMLTLALISYIFQVWYENHKN
jgi:hypothetical protein